MASLNSLETDPELGILLALQGLANAHTTEAESALHAAIQQSAVRQTFPPASPGTGFIAANPNGSQFFVSGTAGGTMWDLESGEPQYSVEVPEGDFINNADFSPDGSLLILPGETYEGDTNIAGPLTIIEADTGRELIEFIAHEALVQAATVSPDGQLFATFSWSDGTPVKIWDLQATLAEGTGQLVQELCCLEGGGTRGRFSPDSSRLATVADIGEEVTMWDLNTGETLFSLDTPWAEDIDFSPEGSYIASASDGMVEIWDAETGERISSVEAHDQNTLKAINFTPDGNYLVSTDLNGSTLWRFSAGEVQKIREFASLQQATIDADITSDGRYLLTTNAQTQGGVAQLWSLDPIDTIEVAAIPAHDDVNSDIQFIGDGANIATAGWDGMVKIWDTATLAETNSTQVNDTWINRIAVSPDSEIVAIAGGDGNVTLWNISSGQQLQVLRVHEPTDTFYEGVIELAFSPDGRLLAAGGSDGNATVWDVATGEQLLNYTAHNDNLDNFEESLVMDITFSPDGRAIASASRDKTVRL
ncbi:MAG: WD40 repeat domain-containing protein [Candidatus Promineifilaceae bacterium]|nr:WD40 repeat domain-containing protein [Candidatus Promineifilaceae bacterium]